MANSYELGFTLDRLGKRYAGLWLYVLSAVVILAVIDARRATKAPLRAVKP